MIDIDHSSVSDPQLTPEGVVLLTIKSNHLRGRGDITIYMPPQAEAEAAGVITLLHGVYGSHWAWMYKLDVHRTLLSLIDEGKVPPFILVMPSDGLLGDGSGYFAHQHHDFESWITQDVVEAVQHYIPSIGFETPWFVCGLSMGGYGAMRLGIRHPERYQAFSGLSSITGLADFQTFTREQVRQMPFDAKVQQLELDDAFLQNRKTLRPFRFDCGTEDPLLESGRGVQIHEGEIEIAALALVVGPGVERETNLQLLTTVLDG